MELTKDEKEYLKRVIKEDLKELKKEGKTVIHHPFPRFLAGEKKLEDFLKKLIEKLE